MKIPLRISKTNKHLLEEHLRKKYNKPKAQLISLLHLNIKEILKATNVPTINRCNCQRCSPNTSIEQFYVEED